MSTKTISITEEAYTRLLTNTRESESFTDVINRITGKTDLLRYAGVLTENESLYIEKRIENARKMSRVRTKKVRL